MIRFVKTDVNKTTFEQKIAAGNAKNEDIVLLPNEKKIWSNGTFYDCDSEEALKSSKAYTDSNISTVNSSLTSHTQNKSNPHNVTKSQVGLGNVDNTSDANKPVSTATQTALDGKISSVKVNGTALSVDANKAVNIPKATTSSDGVVSGTEMTKLEYITTNPVSDIAKGGISAIKFTSGKTDKTIIEAFITS